MKTENKILLAISSAVAIFGAAGLAATNETSYGIIILMSLVGALVSTLEN
jgi:hypothetical protein